MDWGSDSKVKRYPQPLGSMWLAAFIQLAEPGGAPCWDPQTVWASRPCPNTIPEKTGVFRTLQSLLWFKVDTFYLKVVWAPCITPRTRGPLWIQPSTRIRQTEHKRPATSTPNDGGNQHKAYFFHVPCMSASAANYLQTTCIPIQIHLSIHVYTFVILIFVYVYAYIHIYIYLYI